MLTKTDLTQIRTIVREEVAEQLDEQLDEKLKYLPTKDEFYGKMDGLMGEFKTLREEVELVTIRVSDQEDRLEQLETIHPNNAHPLAVKAA